VLGRLGRGGGFGYCSVDPSLATARVIEAISASGKRVNASEI